eukprot:NODE_2871_length_455_cov_189.140394_g2273_i0.p1 GENE.NODE_2871_length_455_cov_189.140394_g2273_i0~~NODE_2871_length_455_cov_189.140394_g2273_i0.p1  ORF type:complete len:121 (+),score=30.15 NODE_2871_length_455_cov_189.140394_g2273_i0:57-365(+)
MVFWNHHRSAFHPIRSPWTKHSRHALFPKYLWMHPVWGDTFGFALFFALCYTVFEYKVWGFHPHNHELEHRVRDSGFSAVPTHSSYVCDQKMGLKENWTVKQ